MRWFGVLTCSRFLLARLYVDSLFNTNTKKDVLDMLAAMRKGSMTPEEAYNDAYKKALARIQGQLPRKSTLAKRTLAWVTFAIRPLTTGELCHALAVELGKKELDIDNIPDIDTVVSMCSGLVVVDGVSDIVRLVHYTTQDYLELVFMNWKPDPREEIASTCLTYVSLDVFRTGHRSAYKREEIEQMTKHNVLLSYAALYWSDHVKPVEKAVCELTTAFLRNDDIVHFVISMIDPSDCSKRESRHWTLFYYQADSSVKRLHLSACEGFPYVTQMLLQTDQHGEAVGAYIRDSNDRTPLHWAASCGHEAIVKLLVERADVVADSIDKQGQTPPAHAAIYGHEAIVKLLVERADVEANSKDENGRTPLSWASSVEVAELLIERGAKVDSIDKDGRTPLSWAVVDRNRADIAELLIERNAKVESVDKDGRTPLSWAASVGCLNAVKLLIERNAKVDSREKRGYTPLMRARKNMVKSWCELLPHADYDRVTKLLKGR